MLSNLRGDLACMVRASPLVSITVRADRYAVGYSAALISCLQSTPELRMVLMSSTSVWVPLVVAALGIFGTLAAALCTQLLQKRRDLEQQKAANLAALSERWLADKQALYAEFI